MSYLSKSRLTLGGVTGLICFALPAHGGTWASHNEGLRNLTVNGISIAPSNPAILYIQARSLGVFKSMDGGLTWSKTATFNNDNGPGYDHLVRQGPAVHPADPNIVWAASGGQVYKTINGGNSWSLSSTGTTVNGCNGVHGVVVDPANPDHLLAGTIVAGCDGGVFESVDAGASWTNIAGSNVPGSGVGNDAWPMVFDPSDSSRLYCGSPHNSVYRSINGGRNWSSTPPVLGDHSTYAVAVNPAATSKVWCEEVRGTWLSSDYGVTWARQTHLFNNAPIITLRFAPSNPQIAYAVAGNTVWQSANNGDTWTARASLNGGPRCLEVDPVDPDVVYVGTAGLGMFKSTDGGVSFVEINAGLPMTRMIRGWQAFGDPLQPGGMYCILDGNTVFHRGAGEPSWSYYSVLPGNGLPHVQIERHRPNRWYVVDGALWRSLDSGLNWEKAYSNGAATSVFDAWLDPRRCGRILLGDRDGQRIVLSEDGGDTWSVLGTVPATQTSLNGISGDPFDAQVILVAGSPPHHAAGQSGYVWRTADGGQTWHHIRDGMFYGDWRIGNGYWRLLSSSMRQEQMCCTGYHVNLDHHTFGNGTFQCRVRILDSNESKPDYWAGFTIRLATPDDHFVDSGWLVYMRRNGVVALHNNVDGTVINAEQTPVVANTATWNTIKLVATGNVFELYANETLVGRYTDLNHRYDHAGYFALQTNRTQADFDNVNIQAESSYSDSFSINALFGGYWGRWVTADPHNPGRFAYATQWGGLWYSTDHGASWYRISGDDRGGYVYYRPLFSTLRSGNLFACSGYGYSWRVDNFYNDGAARQQVGQNLSYSSWLLGEDPNDFGRLYACFYDLGMAVYEGADIIGSPAPPIPVRMDLDADGDIDQSDFGHLQTCLSGPGVAQVTPACAAARLDADDDVDLDDLSLFLSCMMGANVPADPACDCLPR
ncbi:MAG: hypothetical protein AMXMBFR13_17140 [Phycisphaerae bacterium]